MANNNLKFKTNLNCGACVSKVQADLDSSNGIATWTVDTTVPEKVLTVESTGISSDEVINIIKQKGFTAEVI